MTANLLAHSRLFRAGFAESGAYNRSLTPFGFQSERRTFWEVPDLYTKMSPFWYADKIKDPILLMHGEVGRQLRHVPDPVGAALHGAQGPRRDGALRDAAATRRTATPRARRCCT